MVELGTIRLPTGLLVVADMGNLEMWSSHDQPKPFQVARVMFA